ncbi:MAG: CDP-diacylglycerol--glycerol-3-phosphate 3-phosphatidyltransferase, partial [Clostridia bacterium]
MNLPNKLTLTRLILVPFMVVSFYLTPLASGIVPYITTLIFIVAAFTDFLDGNIARKRGIVTDFGKFMDPLADKALVLVALILILDGQIIPIPYIASISLSIMLVRELVVSGLRLVGANKGVVIAADKLGKIKTITQDIAIPALLITQAFSPVLIDNAATSTINPIYSIIMIFGVVMLVIASIVSVISGVSYVLKNI